MWEELELEAQQEVEPVVEIKEVVAKEVRIKAVEALPRILLSDVEQKKCKQGRTVKTTRSPMKKC